MKRITYEQLRSANACYKELRKFKKMFPDGVTLRSEAHAIRLAKAMAKEFDFNWAAISLLRAPARAAYEEATVPAWAAYEEVRATAGAAYVEARATAWAAYLEVRATALAAYEEDRATALAAYKEARATAFAKEYWRMK